MSHEASTASTKKQSEMANPDNTKSEVRIVDYDDKRHHKAFKELNERWIRDLFVVEYADLYEIDHPMENIIDKGGYIFIAELDGEAVGSFAMMKSPNPRYDYELVKFAVNPDIQGKGIGKKLISHCIGEARQLGARRLFLESNRRCEAAVYLYRKFGFREIPITHTDYARCDIQMEMDL